MAAIDLIRNSNQTNLRRDFLNEYLILGSSTISPSSNATLTRFLSICTKDPIKVAGSKKLIQLQYKFSGVEDAHVRSRFWSMLAAHAFHPWLRSWMESACASIPCHFETLVELLPNGREPEIGALLDVWELSELPVAETLSFEKWLREFQPKSRDDCLMALPLYRYYRLSGLTFSTTQTTPDPWLDAMLRSTRGMLLWRYQWTELIRMAGGTTVQVATQLISDYLLKLKGAASSLRNIHYPVTGQSLIQIIKERSPGQMPIGNPDYLTGEWLHKYITDE